MNKEDLESKGKMSNENRKYKFELTRNEDEFKQESVSSFSKSQVNQSESQYAESALGGSCSEPFNTESHSYSQNGSSTNGSKSPRSSLGKCSSSLDTNKQKKKEKGHHHHKKNKHKNFETQSETDSGMVQSRTSSQFCKEKKAIKVAQLSQCLDKLQKSQESKNLRLKLTNTLPETSTSAEIDTPQTSPPQKDSTGVITGTSDNAINNKKVGGGGGGFCVAISLQDGTVMHTTPRITSLLGYPKDMWVGRSFMDFLYQNDRIAFTEGITNAVSNPIRHNMSATDMARRKSHKNVIHCRLRLYNGLKSGKFSVKERKTVFMPFKLIICFKETGGRYGEESDVSAISPDKPMIDIHSVCLLVTCIPLSTAYSHSLDKGPFKHQFIIKHDSNGKITHISDSSLPYLGYTSQDVQNIKIFELYHPEDMEYIKSIYENLVKDFPAKDMVRKPYRMKVYNGCFITLETDWSSYVNPWLKKLEFIIGKHKVIQGPYHPDVFASPSSHSYIEHIDEELVHSTKEMTLSLCSMLKGTFVHSGTNNDHTHRQRRELASFMGTLLDEMAKVGRVTDASTSTDTSTVVLGLVSTHGRHLSSTSPPSYSQLNYNENLYRFFNSHPRTMAPQDDNPNETSSENKSSERRTIESRDGFHFGNQTDYSSSKNENSTKTKKRDHTESGDSGELNGPKGESGSRCSGSASNSGSGIQSGRSSDEHRTNHAPILTERLLYAHNKGMEKKMVENFLNNKKKLLISFNKVEKKQLSRKHQPKDLTPKYPILDYDLFSPESFTSRPLNIVPCPPRQSPFHNSDPFVDSTDKEDELRASIEDPCNPDSLLNSVSVRSLFDAPAQHDINHERRLKPTTTKKNSRVCSRATSVKGEPGSALESPFVESLPSLLLDSSNSSSWFSIFKSSDENMPYSGANSSEDNERAEGTTAQLVSNVPFWLVGIDSNDPMYNHRLEEKDLESVLKSDKQKLIQMQQSYLVNEQLETLHNDVDKVGQTLRPLLDFSTSSSSSFSDDTMLKRKLSGKECEIYRSPLEKQNQVSNSKTTEDAPSNSSKANSPIPGVSGLQKKSNRNS